MWVGTKHYPTPHDFLREAMTMGISKKVPAVPNDFLIGEHIIYMAHRKALLDWEDKAVYIPGIFMTFIPLRIDLVIDDPDNPPSKAVQLKQKYGDLVRVLTVKRAEESQLELI